jgi:glycosyltransferase involved in cell wall biosynthesis
MNPPRISIIVPSFNQAPYIEATLRSVTDQCFPNLELIVMDGASNDGTQEILRRHSAQLAYYESKPDRGQSHAINKGLARATGDIWAYLNSDDLLLPGSLARVAELFSDPATDWIGAVSTIFDETGDRGEVRACAPPSLKEVLTPWNRTVQYIFPCSNVCFMRRSVIERIGTFDESYDYSMDMDYYTRAMFAGYLLRRVPDVLGRWRWHSESKTQREGRTYRFFEEELRIARAYADRLPDDQRAEVWREIAEQTRWFCVRRALHENPSGPRWRKLARLLSDATRHPTLLTFRPWLGAVKQQLLLR